MIFSNDRFCHHLFYEGHDSQTSRKTFCVFPICFLYYFPYRNVRLYKIVDALDRAKLLNNQLCGLSGLLEIWVRNYYEFFG